MSDVIEEAYREATSLFSQAFSMAARIVFWIAKQVLKIAIPLALSGIILICKGLILFVVLLIVTFGVYWCNVGILYDRIKASRGVLNALAELWHYGFSTSEELRYQSDPFSVIDAVGKTTFYRKYFSFVDERSIKECSIRNLMSGGRILQDIDRELTGSIKSVVMPIVIFASSLVSAPFCIITVLFVKQNVNEW